MPPASSRVRELLQMVWTLLIVKRALCSTASGLWVLRWGTLPVSYNHACVVCVRGMWVKGRLAIKAGPLLPMRICVYFGECGATSGMDVGGCLREASRVCK
jgi:hypothetical protein